MGVPEGALGGVEGAEEGAADHVFDADEAGGGEGRVIDEALADVLGNRNQPGSMSGTIRNVGEVCAGDFSGGKRRWGRGRAGVTFV